MLDGATVVSDDASYVANFTRGTLMRYRIQITLTDLEGGAVKTTERTVTFETEKLPYPPHDPGPIDVDQKRRILQAAMDEAVREAVNRYPVGQQKSVRTTDEHLAFLAANRMSV